MMDEALNCTAPSGSISANSDIVGPGVLAAFFVSAILTVAAVFFGHVSGALGDEYLDDVDAEIIKWLRGKAKTVGASIRRLISRAPSSASTEENHAGLDTAKAKHEARRQAVTNFILALSDQQLVTGLAILISGIANQKQLTIYEFSVVLSLAWFSSITHLTTLGALQPYLRKHGAIRDIRACGVALVMVLLMYVFAVIILSSNLPNTVPIQCIFTRQGRLDAGGLGDVGAATIIAWVLALLFIISQYCSRIWELYYDPRARWLAPFHSLAYRFSPPIFGPFVKEAQLPDTEPPLTPDECLDVLNAARRLVNLRALAAESPQYRKFLAWFRLVGGQAPSSVTVIFNLSFGISQVATYRWGMAPQLEADASLMGFGQIMALLLLALPFLSAGECYYDYVEKRRGVTSGDHTMTTPLLPHEAHGISTGPNAALIMDDQSNPQAVRAEYIRLQEQLSRYFARRIYVNRRLEAQLSASDGADRGGLDEGMREMLIEYQELSNCIKDIPIPWLLVPAGLAIAGWVFCGAVFSILVVESEAVWAAIGTFVTVFFFVIHKVWERGAALAKVGPGIQRERTDVEREGHTTGVELDQMTRIISGGAGEGLEEGR